MSGVHRVDSREPGRVRASQLRDLMFPPEPFYMPEPFCPCGHLFGEHGITAGRACDGHIGHARCTCAGWREARLSVAVRAELAGRVEA